MNSSSNHVYYDLNIVNNNQDVKTEPPRLVFNDIRNSNILSKATYMNSFFVKKSDKWENGILYNSIWNGMIFTNGLVKSSTWLDGIFSNGLFYNSNTFNGNNSNFSYNDNNINSFYKSGITRVSSSIGWDIKYNNRRDDVDV